MTITITDLILFSTAFILLFLSIFWILVLFRPAEQKIKSLKNYPFFSTIVPAYNEEDSIVGTLTSLVNLDYPIHRREIIVVNDGSTDRTTALVEEFVQAHPQEKIILIHQPNRGKGSAMNTGLSRARGEFFASLDADSFVSRQALKVMLPYFQDPKVAAVCPLLKVRKPDSMLQKVQWYEYVVNMFYKHLNAQLDCIHVTPGPFSVYRTKVIRKLGCYDEKNITEDLEIAIRLQKHHYKIIQTFDAVVETVAPHTWKSLFLQRVRWYKGSVDNSWSYRKLIFNRDYGDFGIMRMPTILFSGFIAIVLTITLLQETIVRAVRHLMALKEINFDLITLLKNYSWDINFLSLPFFKYIISLVLIAISFWVMLYSFKLVKEKITHYGRTWISLLVYLTIYAFFISVVWMYIAYIYVYKKNYSWHSSS